MVSGLKWRKRVNFKLATLLCQRLHLLPMVQPAEDGIRQQPKCVCDGEVYLRRNSYEPLGCVDRELAQIFWYHRGLNGLPEAWSTATSTTSGARHQVPEAVACA